MENNNQLWDEITFRFKRIVNKFNRIQRHPRDFGTGGKLYIAEAHTLDAVSKNSGCTITELAAIKGVTRGAASQLVTKLARKGYLLKTKEADNDKSVRLFLTAKGEQAAAAHDRLHRGFFEMYLSNTSPDQLRALNAILKTMDEFTDDRLNETEHHPHQSASGKLR
ncbi:MAG: MarR family winged helix-turn-helix transcriptional regulator [Thermodesulfobacteriota bacterium]|nr:MarR family winged helix-turn-helix transcriptional regulator [Thermodesulfobacteriota bacterium]